MSERDWMSVLATSLRESAGTPTMSTEAVDALIADVVSGRIAPPATSGRPRRHQARWVVGGIAISLLAGGTTVAAVWRSNKPGQPHEGIACHASTELQDSRTIVVSQTADALEACGELWRTGALPDSTSRSVPADVVPPLFSCVGTGAGLEVFPELSGSAASCAELGLADVNGGSAAEPSNALHVRLMNDINLQCVDLAAAGALVQSALADLGLQDWTIQINGSPSACVKAGQSPDIKAVYLFSLPT